MYTLKGIFPEPKKEQKKNFIKENVKQLKYLQGKGPNESKLAVNSGRASRANTGQPARTVDSVESSSSAKSGNPPATATGSSISRKKQPPNPEVKFKKGDMSEFLKRKEMRQLRSQTEPKFTDTESESPGTVRDVGCQTVESNFAQKPGDGAKLTVLYPKTSDADHKAKASGDTGRNKTPSSPSKILPGQFRSGDTDALNSDRTRGKLSPEKDKDPYLPSGYQKGVLPKYLRQRKEQGKEQEEVDESHAVCPPGHVTLPDNERKDTLRMLRNSFAELVSELNKMPVRTDTLRMRNRKMELEKQLAKLEEGIKVFSRPKVFVKIGE